MVRAGTGLPTHTFTPIRRSGWGHKPTNRERALRLLRERKLWLASKAGKEIRAYRASGLPTTGRGGVGPRGVARRLEDRGMPGVDGMAVAIPSAEAGKMDVAVLVVGIPPADLEGVVARINVELGEAFGNTTMLAHPLVRDRRNDGGKMVIPSTEDLVVRRKMVKARSSVYPSPTYSWETQDGGIRKLRAFLLDRLVAPTVHAPGFHMGVAVRGEYASPVGSFNPHAGVSADDQVVEEVDLDELPNEEAEVQVKAARVAHRERHVAFFERNPEPDQFHLQGCGDCDVYCRTFGIQRPLPSEEVGAEEVGFGSRRREYAYGYDPPIG